MFTRNSLTFSVVVIATIWSLTGCGAPAMETGATADKPTAESAMAETKAMTATAAMSASQAMTESTPLTETHAMTDSMALTETHAMTETMAMTETHAMTTSTAMADEAMMMLHGVLVGLGDGQHEGAGDVEIAGKVGAYTLKLTNFTSSEGPDLHVILSKNADPIAEKVGADWLDLGELQATSGDQAYSLPADADLSAYKSVVIYCVSYDFVFSAATLQ